MTTAQREGLADALLELLAVQMPEFIDLNPQRVVFRHFLLLNKVGGSCFLSAEPVRECFVLLLLDDPPTALRPVLHDDMKCDDTV